VCFYYDECERLGQPATRLSPWTKSGVRAASAPGPHVESRHVALLLGRFAKPETGLEPVTPCLQGDRRVSPLEAGSACDYLGFGSLERSGSAVVLPWFTGDFRELRQDCQNPQGESRRLEEGAEVDKSTRRRPQPRRRFSSKPAEGGRPSARAHPGRRRSLVGALRADRSCGIIGGSLDHRRGIMEEVELSSRRSQMGRSTQGWVTLPRVPGRLAGRRREDLQAL
jgi:hypothetical protein